MSSTDNKLAIGTLLESAGLISSQQLRDALAFQSQYSQMKLGEILVIQEIIKAQTIDFFINKWQSIKREGQQYPIGYYLKDACLLDDKQIEIILSEQKKKQHKFGAIAVKKGWLKQNTVDFFLNSLSVKAPPLVSFSFLKQYNQETLHLERKYTNPNDILNRILAWTGGNYILTKAICHAFADSSLNIPLGEETTTVDRFVEKKLIRKWQTVKEAKYLRYIKNKLVNNQRCDSILLLKEYQEILLAGSKRYLQNEVQQELLILGLVVEREDCLQITNLIYQQVFHQDWIAAQIAKLKQQELAKSNALTQSRTGDGSRQNEIAVNQKINKPHASTRIDHSGVKSKQKNKNFVSQNQIFQSVSQPTSKQNSSSENAQALEPITKLASRITLSGIILLIPLVWMINNYYSPLQSTPQAAYKSLTDTEKMQQFCEELNLVDPRISLNLISQLEKNKKIIFDDFPNNLEAFPKNCEIALNKLRVLAAPQLGKESRVLEAISNLCKVPLDSESINEAKIWLDHWYNSPDWGQKTQSYLNLTSECPANDR